MTAKGKRGQTVPAFSQCHVRLKNAVQSRQLLRSSYSVTLWMFMCGKTSSPWSALVHILSKPLCRCLCASPLSQI